MCTVYGTHVHRLIRRRHRNIEIWAAPEAVSKEMRL